MLICVCVSVDLCVNVTLCAAFRYKNRMGPAQTKGAVEYEGPEGARGSFPRHSVM